jgi:hypothetical protein
VLDCKYFYAMSAEYTMEALSIWAKRKMQRYFAPVLNVVVVIIIDGSRLERLLYGKISERSAAVLHAEIGTAAQYRRARGPQDRGRMTKRQP